MQSKQLSSNEYLLVFTEPDVELMGALNQFAADHNIPSGRLQAIGSVSTATLAWWSNDTKVVEKYTADGQFELVSFLGNITSNTEGPRIHAHAVMTGPGGLVAGHAVSLTVRASVEVSITVFETPVVRVKNDGFGLWIIDLDA
jgi:predicted DNA-binding protein with PD1-like motif